MDKNLKLLISPVFLPAISLLASCGVPSSAGGSGQAVENAIPIQPGPADQAFVMEDKGTFEKPWALAFVPGTDVLMMTTKAGEIRGLDTATGRAITVSGAPMVDYGGQGGLGDIAFLASESADTMSSRTIYLSYAEAGAGDLRGAAIGRGTLDCAAPQACKIQDFHVIWRQDPKVSGRGHFSHRLAFSPDGQYLFVSSGDRQKMDPAQDPQNNLGSIVRLNLNGTSAAGNPLADGNVAIPEIWSFGHRNVLGLAFDGEGRLWGLEHGPKGGDELNLIEAGANYGWPVVSNGDHYNGQPIPNHETRREFHAPAISWNPVIAPGDLLFPNSSLFPQWNGRALIAGLSSEALVEVALDGEKAVEKARYDFGNRLRALAQAPDGSIWVAEDGANATLWRLTPRQAR